jgi:pantothenate synthetase
VEAPVLVAGALWVGNIRLIDNVVCAPGGRES